MTKKAMKLLFTAQLKTAIWYLVTYALVVGIISLLSHYIKDLDQDWVIISAIHSPKIYLLVMGIVYPLITMEIYLSRGLTRKQYFCALTCSIGIISLVLIIPPIIAQIFMDTLTPLSLAINLIQLPLYFLIGWTAIVGFQLGKWYRAALGVLGAIACGHIISTIPTLFRLSEIVQLGISLVLLIVQITFLPHIIRRVPIKTL